VVNRQKSWYSVKNTLATDDGPPEVLIYGEIDSYFGVSAADFVRDLAKIDAPEITVRINSIGGDAFDGVAILNALRGHDATITVVVDGIAASIASVIAMAGDQIVMNQNSQMMVHNAWAVSIGDANDMARTADMLGRQNTNIASIYAARAGGTVEDWLAVMDEETWMTADEAVESGLADRVSQPSEQENLLIAARASAFDLSKFKYPGREAAPAPRIAARAQTPQPVEAEVTEGKEPIVATLTESVLQKLGLDAEADESAIEAAIDEKIAAAETKSEAPPEAPEPTVDQLPQVAAKFGLTVLDKTVHDRLVADAALGAQAHARMVAEDQEHTIRAALEGGQITPASADTWRAQLKENPAGVKALLETMPKNSAVPVAAVGYGAGREDTSVDPEMETALAKIVGQPIGKA
jgi:ATP-dependent protease ClpP protease subunit